MNPNTPTRAQNGIAADGGRLTDEEVFRFVHHRRERLNNCGDSASTDETSKRVSFDGRQTFENDTSLRHVFEDHKERRHMSEDRSLHRRKYVKTPANTPTATKRTRRFLPDIPMNFDVVQLPNPRPVGDDVERCRGNGAENSLRHDVSVCDGGSRNWFNRFARYQSCREDVRSISDRPRQTTTVSIAAVDDDVFIEDGTKSTWDQSSSGWRSQSSLNLVKRQEMRREETVESMGMGANGKQCEDSTERDGCVRNGNINESDRLAATHLCRNGCVRNGNSDKSDRLVASPRTDGCVREGDSDKSSRVDSVSCPSLNQILRCCQLIPVTIEIERLPNRMKRSSCGIKLAIVPFYDVPTTSFNDVIEPFRDFTILYNDVCERRNGTNGPRGHRADLRWSGRREGAFRHFRSSRSHSWRPSLIAVASTSGMDRQSEGCPRLLEGDYLIEVT